VVVVTHAIAPLLFPVRTPSAGRAHPPRAGAARCRGLSLPEPPITRTADTVYGMSALDRGGRIADRPPVEPAPGQRGEAVRAAVAAMDQSTQQIVYAATIERR
jgi:hypothetical protein